MLRDTLKTLLAAYGPSGNEYTVAETVKAEVAKAEAEKIGLTGKNGKTRKKKRTGK